MRPPRVSDRLRFIASLVLPGARLIDVGCDHALLPIYYLLGDPEAKAVAIDNKDGPLRVAAKNVSRWGLDDRLTLIRGDGIPSGLLQAGDCVVIAGLGGVEIGQILSQIGSAAAMYVLSPHSRAEVLRETLSQLSLAIVAETVKAEGGRTYLVMTVKPSVKSIMYSDDERWIGPHCLTQLDADFGDAAFLLYMRRLKRHLSRVVRHDPTAASPLARLERYIGRTDA